MVGRERVQGMRGHAPAWRARSWPPCATKKREWVSRQAVPCLRGHGLLFFLCFCVPRRLVSSSCCTTLLPSRFASSPRHLPDRRSGGTQRRYTHGTHVTRRHRSRSRSALSSLFFFSPHTPRVSAWDDDKKTQKDTSRRGHASLHSGTAEARAVGGDTGHATYHHALVFLSFFPDEFASFIPQGVGRGLPGIDRRTGTDWTACLGTKWPGRCWGRKALGSERDARGAERGQER